jgi:hypothetical protein
MYINIAGRASVFDFAPPLHTIPLWGPVFWLYYMVSLELAGIAVGAMFVLKIRHPKPV